MDQPGQNQSIPSVLPQQPAMPATQAGLAPVQEPPVKQEHQMPVSGHNKEAGFSVTVSEASAVAPSPQESMPEIPPEVKEAGVEAAIDTQKVQVPQPVQQLTGVTPAKADVPVVPVPVVTVGNMNDIEAEQVVKTRPVTDSMRWLAMLVVEHAKRVHSKVTGK